MTSPAASPGACALQAPRHTRQGWCVVVPIKQLDRAKSRLTGIPRGLRAVFARAFALDTLTAAAASPAVFRLVVVTGEESLRPRLERLGVAVLADPMGAGLNAALAHAAAAARRWHSGAAIAALTADLPALKPDDLSLALATTWPMFFVPDTAGQGTTLLAARSGAEFGPHFGADSADRHRATGALPVPMAAAGLRRDVDTVADLLEALALGVGPHTRSAARSCGVRALRRAVG